MVRPVVLLLTLCLLCSLLPLPAAASQHPQEACPVDLPSAGFADVTGEGVHAHAIDCVAWWEIAHGDGRGNYRPGAAVRRDQTTSMLVRLLAAVERPPEPAGDQGFTDVGGNVHADAVNALAALGVVRGVSPTRFAPANPVRRDQMASLLVRVHEAHFDPLPAGGDRFDDIAGNVHAEAIGKLAAAGVTTGHTETAFEPAGLVTRAQMASLLLRLLSLWIREGLVEVVNEDDPDQGDGNAASHSPSVSASGRYVAFVSQATNLIEGDSGQAAQIFVRDRARGQTTMVSTGPGGQPGDGDADEPSISGDGRYVAFMSRATNLADGDTNGVADVFVHDRLSARTHRVSVSSGNGQANDRSGEPTISADGRVVAFTSSASNLVTGDTNDAMDVFVHDRSSGATSRASVPSPGAQADRSSASPSISGNGRYVTFESEAANVVGGDTNDEIDVFLHDRDREVTDRVSVTRGGEQADGPSRSPAISANGRYVAYETAAPGLLKFPSPDHPELWHVLMYDRQSGDRTVATWLADGHSHSPVTSDDGRVAFASSATNLSGAWPDNGIDHVYEWSSEEFSTVKLSVNDVLDEQANAHSYQPAISANGLVVAFVSTAPNVIPSAARGVPNVLAHKWRDRLCMAVLVSMAVHSRKQEPFPDTDDDDRCEDRTTAPLLRRADEIHNLLVHGIARSRRTTAAVRARDHTGACRIILAAGAERDLDPDQRKMLRGDEIAAKLKGADAELTALAEILWIRGWKPLALGIAPEERTICEICQWFIETHPPPPANGTVTSSRTAVWP